MKIHFAPVAISLLALASASGCASAPAHPANAPAPAPAEETLKPIKDPRALDELKKLSNALTGAKSLSFDAMSMTPIQGPNRQWVHVFSTAKVKLQRPQQLFVESGGDAFPQKTFYDGKTYAVSAPEKKLFTQQPMTGSIDSMLAQASAQGENAYAFADVLLADPLASWTKDLDGAIYVGESVRGKEKLEHLALQAKDVSWEVWTDLKTHLPRMVYVKYTGAERTPSVLIEFSKWKLNQKFPASTFTFRANSGTKKAKFKAPGGSAK